MNRPCKELKRIARKNLIGQYRISMGAILVLGIIPLAAELPFSMLQSPAQPLGQTIIFYIADFLISLIAFILSAGVIYLNLHIARKKQPTLGMVFYAFKNHSDRFILVGLLMTLLSVVAAIPAIIGGVVYYLGGKSTTFLIIWIVLALVSVLLIIFFELQYSFSTYLLLDHPQMGVIEALRTSRHLMKGNRGRLLYQFFSFLGLHALCLLSLGIGSLWVLPYQYQTTANFYLDLIGELPANLSQQDSSPQKEVTFNQYI